MRPIVLARCDPDETFGVAIQAFDDAGAPVRIWQALDGEPRPELDEAAGVVVFGSTYNVEHADEQPFIEELRTITIDAVERGVPYLGVCFGSQILAWSLGGAVGKAAVREFGFVPVRPTPSAQDDRLFGHLEDGDAAFQWHMDTFELPPGAELLVRGDEVEHQAFRVGDRAWAAQFHFEVNGDELEHWLESYGPEARLVAEWGRSWAEVREQARTHLAAHEARGREIFRRFAQVAQES